MIVFKSAADAELSVIVIDKAALLSVSSLRSVKSDTAPEVKVAVTVPVVVPVRLFACVTDTVEPSTVRFKPVILTLLQARAKHQIQQQFHH